MVTLRRGDASAEIDHQGTITRLRVASHDLLTPAGSFVMAPWAGRTRRGRFTFAGVEHQLALDPGPHAIHGTVRDRTWTAVEAGDDRVRMTCDFGPDWPFEGRAEQLLVIHHDHLELELSVHATGGPMPAVCGWHPWWRRRLDAGEPAVVDLPATAMYVRDGDHIATAETVAPPPPGPWDDCFTGLTGPPVLRWEGVMEIAIESDCACVVVYDELEDSICVEPQSGPPDALNHQPTVVEPGHPLVVHSLWRWRT